MREAWSRRLSRSRRRILAARARPASLPRVFVSDGGGGDIAQRLGAPHYSYHFAAARFVALLAREGPAPYRLEMPETIATMGALPGGGGQGAVHLIFRSTAQIRLLKPAVNICCFAWEFPVLKTALLPGDHPFDDQRRMLSLCDEIWTPSDFTLQVLRAHGLQTAQRIPAPVPAAPARLSRDEALGLVGDVDAVTLAVNFLWPRAYAEQQAEARRTDLRTALARHRTVRTIYLAVLNPEDDRKNIDALLRGFHLFRMRHPDAVLIVKALTARNRFSLAAVATDVVAHKLSAGTTLADEGIVLISHYLSEPQMAALYCLADFYVCTSLAEGQNLPLLEAMAQGTIAVSTRNTAMLDYIDDATAFVVAAREQPNDNIHLAGTVALRPFAVSLCGARDVCASLCAAEAATPRQRGRKARAGIAVVQRMFGEAAVWASVRARLRHHAS